MRIVDIDQDQSGNIWVGGILGGGEGRLYIYHQDHWFDLGGNVFPNNVQAKSSSGGLVVRWIYGFEITDKFVYVLSDQGLYYTELK